MSWPSTFSRWKLCRPTSLPSRSGKACTVARGGNADDVDRPELAPVGGLALGQVAHREKAVAVAGGVLEALERRRVEHLLLELALDRLRVAREELDDAVDDLGVVLPGDV